VWLCAILSACAADTTETQECAASACVDAAVHEDGGKSALPEPACGNGRVESGERCDDGNLDDADTCNADCRPPASVVWLHDDEPHLIVGALALSADGKIAVGGTTLGTSGETDQWVELLDPDGEPMWSQWQRRDTGGDEIASALAFAANGDVIALTTRSSSDGRALLLTMHSPTDGAPPRPVDPLFEVQSPTLSGHDLFVTDDMRFVVLGTVEGQFEGAIRLDQYDLLGRGVSQREIDSDFDDVRGVLGASTTGMIRAVWPARTAAGFELIDCQLDLLSGTAMYTESPIDEPELELPIELALDAAGNIVVCARRHVAAGFEVWLHEYTRNGAPLWNAPVIETAGDDLGCRDVAVDASGNIAVLAASSRPDGDFWLRRYDPQGRALWGEPVTHESGATDLAGRVAFDPDGNVVIASTLRTPQRINRRVLAKYAR
jgi:cysteine-rich repeat protein